MDTEQRQSREAGEVAGDEQAPGIHAYRSTAIALTGAALLLGCMLGLLLLADLRGAPRATVGLLLAAGVGHALACLGLRGRWRGLDASGRRTTLVAIGLIALAIRLLAFGLPPTLSDDIYRYRWDGRVQAAGLNPYPHPPAAVELEPLRDAEWERINYPRIRTIYPPLAQLLFAATYRVADGLTGFRAVAALGDLLCIVLLAACAAALGLPGWAIALYALHPLPPIEFASSGHFDAWVMSAVLLAVWAHVTRRPALSTLALGAGILLKSWPVVLVPFLLRGRPLWHWGLLAATVAAGFLPYADAGIALLHPWLEYAGRWRFNDGLFRLLLAATGSLAAAKAAAAAIGLGLLGWLWRMKPEPLAGAYWILLAFILLMPTIHPWYLLWALPLAALAGDAAWILVCTLAPTAYWILVGAGSDSDVWVEPAWPAIVEYVPTVLLWLALAWRGSPPAPGRTSPLFENGARKIREPAR